MELIIENVSKLYRGNVWGLKNLSLKIKSGVFGLLGPNGAGKTTLMNILATVTRPTEGKVSWNGVDIVRSPEKLRSVLGYLPQYFGIYPNLNAVEFLKYLAALKGLGGSATTKRINDLLELVNISDMRKRPLGSLSGGLKQRVGIAQALLNDPKLLIVDEPTVGLDPQERVRFRNLLTDLSKDRVVILSTHIVSDVESSATEIAIINKGQLLEHAPPEKLLQDVEGKVWGCTLPSAEFVEFRQRHLISSTIRRSDGVHARVVADEPPESNAEMLSPSLEDAYLYKTSSSDSQLLEQVQ